MKPFVLSATIALVLAATSANAQPAPAVKPLGESLTGDAKSEYEAGRLLFTNEDFAGASTKMQHAYELSKDPRLLWNIAACEKRLRHYAKVIPLVTQYRAEASHLITPEQMAEAQEVLNAMRPFVTKVTVNVDQPEAAVRVDDVIVATSPMKQPVLVDMGPHVVKVEKDGFKKWSESREIPGATELVMDVRLVKDLHEGRLIVNAGAKDQISVDGSPRGFAQFSSALSSGVHSVRITAPGMKAHDEEVRIEDDATRTLNITLESEKGSGGGSTWLWVGIGGGVALVTGVIITAVLLSNNSGTDTVAPLKTGTLPPNVIELSRIFR